MIKKGQEEEKKVLSPSAVLGWGGGGGWGIALIIRYSRIARLKESD